MKAMIAPSSKPRRTEEGTAKSARNYGMRYSGRFVNKRFGKNFNSYRFTLMYYKKKIGFVNTTILQIAELKAKTFSERI